MSDIKSMLESFAKEHSLIFSSKKDAVINAIEKRIKEFGAGYCPCKRIKADKLGDYVDIICPCKHVLDDIAKSGHCYCNLFVKP